MAIFHISAKAVSRSKGRSATAAAAYRAGERIKDERTGEVHDYTKKQGVLYSEIVTPDGVAVSREVLWNLAEAAEKRKDGTPAKEYEIALPDEVSAEERKRIAIDFAKAIVKQEKCAVDVCIHEPNKKGDTRNHHAHLLCTTREVMPTGTLGEKCAISKSDRDRQKMGLSSGKTALVKLREMLAGIINMALERSGVSDRVDHRTLSEQGIDREPTKHKGPAAVNMERRGKVAERAAIEPEVSAPRHETAAAVAEELARLEREEAAESRDAGKVEPREVAEESAAIEREAPAPSPGLPPATVAEEVDRREEAERAEVRRADERQQAKAMVTVEAPAVAEELAEPEREEVAESREVIEPEPGNVIEERDPEAPAPRHETAAAVVEELAEPEREEVAESRDAGEAEPGKATEERATDEREAPASGRESAAMTVAEITALLAEHKRDVAAAFAAERAEAEAKAAKNGAAIGGREELAKPKREETAEAKEAKETARREAVRERMAAQRVAARERMEARLAAKAAEAAASEREAQQREQQQREAEQKAREEAAKARRSRGRGHER